MTNKRKLGRPNPEHIIILKKRRELVSLLQEERWKNIDIAKIFNVSPAQITRDLNTIE